MDLSTPYVMSFAAATTLGLLALLRLAQHLLASGRGAMAFSDAAGSGAAVLVGPDGAALVVSAPAASPSEGATEQLAPPSPGAVAQGAKRLLQVGQVLAVFTISTSIVKNCLTGELARDAGIVAAYGVAGLLLLTVFGHLGVRLLFGAGLPAEIERGNVAAGVAAGAHYIAVGLLCSRAAAGPDFRGLGLAFAFFVLAQLTHQLFIALFRALTTYDDAEQISGENLAAALSYAGASIAVALFVSRALEGDFESWSVSLLGFAQTAAFAVVLYPVRQLIVQTFLLGGRFSLRGGALDSAIAVHRSEGSAAMEAVTLFAVALAYTSLA